MEKFFILLAQSLDLFFALQETVAKENLSELLVHLRQHEVLFGGSRTAILLEPISHDSS